jgi:hypothetical protein
VSCDFIMHYIVVHLQCMRQIDVWRVTIQPAYLTARAAVSITRATARGWEMWTAWLALSTVTFDPARLAIHRASSGLSARSWVATMA